jgi:hypothetical protein
MDPLFSQLLTDLRRSRFSDLTGSRAAIDLSLSDALINRAIAAVLAGSQGRLRGVTVAAQPGDRLHLDLQLARSFVPSIGVEAMIERQPELPGLPEIVLRWRTIVPGLAALAGSAAAFFKELPPGVRLEADRVFLDLRPLAARAGVADLFPLLSELRVLTRQGAVDLHLVARVSNVQS